MFSEINTVEYLVRDLLASKQDVRQVGIGEETAGYLTAGRSSQGVGWHYVSSASLPRQSNEVFIEPYVRNIEFFFKLIFYTLS